MIRTVVYPEKGAEPEVLPESHAETGSRVPDDYKAKLVKYIPAEVIGFYLPAYALVTKSSPIVADTDKPTAQIIVLVVSLLGLIGYLFIRSDKNSPPRIYFYLLAGLAFLAWAIGTSSVGQDVFHIPEWWNELTVLAAVFLIPMLDEMITRLIATVSKTS